jgi:nucleoside 2-deoxyribosyltransferase
MIPSVRSRIADGSECAGHRATVRRTEYPANGAWEAGSLLPKASRCAVCPVYHPRGFHRSAMKIYLAGPDVFRPDAAEWADSARELCRRYGYDPLTPLDHGETDAADIFRANIDLIRKAQVVVANLNPFRGAEPDSGTCFELGYALALGKKICGYLARMESLRERVNRFEKGDERRTADDGGMVIEDFGLPVNLMLAVPAHVVEGDLDDCLKSLGGGLMDARRQDEPVPPES